MILNAPGLLEHGLGKQSNAARPVSGFDAVESAFAPPAGFYMFYDFTDAAFGYQDAARSVLISADGQTVNGWVDQGSKALHVDTDGENVKGPVYVHEPGNGLGMPGLLFSGTTGETGLDPEAAIAGTGESNVLYAAVISLTGTEAANSGMVFSADAGDYVFKVDTTNIDTEIGGYSSNASAHSDSTTEFFSVIMLAGADATFDARHIKNNLSGGIEVGSVPPASTNFGIGKRGGFEDNHLSNTYIHEVLVYDDVEQNSGGTLWEAVETYFENKYGAAMTFVAGS
jgi:hypothetical protein